MLWIVWFAIVSRIKTCVWMGQCMIVLLVIIWSKISETINTIIAYLTNSHCNENITNHFIYLFTLNLTFDLYDCNEYFCFDYFSIFHPIIRAKILKNYTGNQVKNSDFDLQKYCHFYNNFCRFDEISPLKLLFWVSCGHKKKLQFKNLSFDW